MMNLANQPGTIPRLSSGIDDTVDTLTVDNWTYHAAHTPGDFVIRIDNEYIYVGTRTGNVLSGLVRDYEEPGAAAAHSANAQVRVVFTRATVLNLISFKQTILVGSGNKTTTSTSFVPIHATDLGYLTLPCKVGDVLEAMLVSQTYNSGANSAYFDFEVDYPVSANSRIYEAADSGGMIIADSVRVSVGLVARLVVTEAGIHGVRPVWKVSAGTQTLPNATSGNDDTAILFSLRNLGPVTV